MPVAGVGYLLVNDLLTDAAYALVEPSVNTTVPGGGIAAGPQTVPVFDLAMYAGAQIIVGVANGDIEVVTITAVVPGTSFSAVFANAHPAGESIVGATFPVRQPTDPFFTQAEMLAYIATAANDFLGECPLVIAVSTAVSVPPTQQVVPLPSDCMKPTRVAAYGYPFRETSQSNLDIDNFQWQQRAATGPYAYFRDKVGVQNMGVWPAANNTTPLEIVYEQRAAAVMGLADGFIIPDPFLLYVLCRTLEFAYSKDGEQRNPGLARYYNGRYAQGVKISNMFLEAINDSNLEMAQ